MTINECYASMNKAINGRPSNDLKKVIWDCFDYGIFKLKPTKQHKQWFKDCFDVDYPIDESELTKSLIKELKSCVKIRKEDREFEEKMSKQRKNRGYSDKDVWSIRDWFLDIMPKMLQQMRDNLHRYPAMSASYPINSQTIITPWDEKLDKDFVAWQEVLDKMIFLLKEMNEDTCSFENKYQKEVNKAQDEFYKKYGCFGEKFEELNNIESNSSVNKRIYFYYDDPEHPEWKELNDDYHRAELHKYTYMNECREEFFNLFSKYFWNLWD